jgi:peptide/nickel transport system substrate-binding protein
MKLSLFRVLASVILLSLVLTACAPQAAAPAAAPAAATTAATAAPRVGAPAADMPAAPTTAPTTEAPAEAEVEAAEPVAAGGWPVPNMAEYENAAREETLIVDRPNRLEGADNWNPLVPGNATGFGYQTIGRTPIVLLSYGTGQIENYMADSFTANEDSSVWTLRLKTGITWSDGHPFTVDDIIYSMEIQKNTPGLGAYGAYLEWIQELNKIDDFTMEIVLTKANPRYALERCADHLCGYDQIIAKHVWEQQPDPLTFKNLDLEKGWPLTTGPYVLTKITTNETIMVRNDNWWAAQIGFKPLPAPKRVIHSFVGAEEVRVATAADNGFDIVEDITLSSYEALLSRNENWKAFQAEMPYVFPDPCARTLTVNNAVPPWDDKDMRWMLSNVMDRPQIIDVAYEGTTIPGAYFWPLYPSMQKYTDLVPQDKAEWMLTPHLDEAEATLLAKGYTKDGEFWTKDGETLSLEIQVHESYSELERVADVYIEQLIRFGIDAKKAKLTGGTWGDNVNLGQYEAQSGWQTCGSIMEPYNTLRTLIGTDGVAPIGERPVGRQNLYRFNNARFNELTDEIGLLQLDDPRLPELAREAYEILYDEMPAIPTAQSRKLVPNNVTYWTNWPDAENYYHRPFSWCGSFIDVITQIQPVTQ